MDTGLPPLAQPQTQLGSPGETVPRVKWSHILPQPPNNSLRSVRVSPPPLPPKPRKISTGSSFGGCDTPDDSFDLDENDLLNWWKSVKPWDYLSKDETLIGKGVVEIFTVKARRIHNAIQLYKLLLTKHGETLSNHMEELRRIAKNLDKVSKGTKIAGITGGTTSAVGGAAAVAGIVLAPFTLGASLALTAVGVGVAAAGGVTGASAAIAHKVNMNQDRKKIETNLNEYNNIMVDIDNVLKFINKGGEQLRRHSLCSLEGVRVEALRVAKILEEAGGEASCSALEASSMASGMMEGFALGMDMYYTKGKNGLKLKKRLASQLAVKLRQVIETMNSGLTEHMRVKELF